jgi:hypothetical protein
MPGRPKFSVFQSWVQPSSSKKTNGDRPGSPPLVESDENDPQVNIKLAVFFVVVALSFVLAEHLGRVQEPTGANLGLDSTALVSLTVSPPQRSGNRIEFSVPFRLSNRGNHAIFYPINAATRLPAGQLVARTSPSTEWMSVSSASKRRLSPAQEFMDSNLTWIEMSPGGWVDGEFFDTGESPEEHAYVIYVKPARNANGIRIVSKSYASPRN